MIKRQGKGFTLIELIIVITIIGLIAASILFSINRARQKSRIARAQADLDQIAKAVVLLELDTHEFPGHILMGEESTEVISDLTTPSAGIMQTDGDYENWQGPYIQNISKDPWGQNYFLDYIYSLNGQNQPVVGSFGPNKIGPDEDDIVKGFYK